MAYVEPSTANNRRIDSLAAIESRNGPGTWRERIAATARQRTLFHRRLPGTDGTPHRHPGADELFLVHGGRAVFDLGGRLVEAEPGTVIYVPKGRSHDIRVAGAEPLRMVVFVAPNAQDDAVAAGLDRATSAPVPDGPRPPRGSRDKDPGEAGRTMVAKIKAIRRQNGSGAWRQVVAVSDELRVALHRRLPGEEMRAHHHRGDELFIILEGEATFDFGDGRVVPASEDSVVYAPEGQPHGLRVSSRKPLLMMCLLAPNNSPPDYVEYEQ